MEPNKFEETIRETLQEREIQPSADAWSKLDARLGKPEKKKNFIIWYAVAASLISILVIGSLLFRNSETGSGSEDLVTVPSDTVDFKKQPEFIPQKTPSAEIASENDVITEKNSEENIPQKNMAKEQIKHEKSQEITSEKIPDKAIAKNETKVNEENQSTKVSINKERFVNTKIDEVVAQVKEIQNKNHEVTPQEIDALLAKAEREIKTRQIINSNTNKVDAAALLLDVELELEKSFREKVFDALGEGFNKVRTAFVERNN